MTLFKLPLFYLGNVYRVEMWKLGISQGETHVFTVGSF